MTGRDNYQKSPIVREIYRTPNDADERWCIFRCVIERSVGTNGALAATPADRMSRHGLAVDR